MKLSSTLAPPQGSRTATPNPTLGAKDASLKRLEGSARARPLKSKMAARLIFIISKTLFRYLIITLPTRLYKVFGRKAGLSCPGMLS